MLGYIFCLKFWPMVNYMICHCGDSRKLPFFFWFKKIYSVKGVTLQGCISNIFLYDYVVLSILRV